MENKDYQAAIDKLRDEMAAAKLPAVSAVGEIMTALLQAAPDWAGAILAKGKTLAGAYAALEKYARDNRNGKDCVSVPPETAQMVICRYYGIKMDERGETTSSDLAALGHLPLKGKAGAAPEPDPFDLDALLASGEAGLKAQAQTAQPQDAPETRDRAQSATGAGREMGVSL